MFLIIKVRYNKKIEIYKQENVKKGTKMFFFLSLIIHLKLHVDMVKDRHSFSLFSVKKIYILKFDPLHLNAPFSNTRTTIFNFEQLSIHV